MTALEALLAGSLDDAIVAAVDAKEDASRGDNPDEAISRLEAAVKEVKRHRALIFKERGGA